MGRQMLFRRAPRTRRERRSFALPLRNQSGTHRGRCRTTLIDSSRLVLPIKLTWKINFSILCKLKCAALSWPFCLSFALFFFFSPSRSSVCRLIWFCSSQNIKPSVCFCVSPCLYSSSLSSVLIVPCTDRRRIAHSTNWLRWNAIMLQKPIVMKKRRTFIISIKTGRQCQSCSTMGQHNINRLLPLISPPCQLIGQTVPPQLLDPLFVFFSRRWAEISRTNAVFFSSSKSALATDMRLLMHGPWYKV